MGRFPTCAGAGRLGLDPGSDGMRGGRWKGPVETSEDDQMFQVASLHACAAHHVTMHVCTAEPSSRAIAL